MLSLIAAALLVQAQNPAASTALPIGATPTKAAAAAAKPGAVDGDKVVCHTEVATGSMFGGPKECHTKSEWAAINAASRDSVNSFQQRSNQSFSPH